MTVEIAVINKEAVALAADSAVTITGSGGHRIFESAEKLFSVSESHPIGVMIYNNASFMGIPWETVVSMYRASVLKTGKCETLREYADNMISVLNSLATRIPAEVEEKYLRRALEALFEEICRGIKGNIGTKEQRAAGKETARERLRRKIVKVADDYLSRISALPDISAPVGFDGVIDAKYGSVVQDVAGEVFERNGLKLQRSSSAEAKLKEIGTKFFSKNIEDFFMDEEYSGLVIAGLGEQELFPSVITFHIRGALQGVLIYHEVGKLYYSVDFDRPGAIIPFAQRDVIDTFKYGIRPDYIEDIKERIDMKCFESFVNSVPSIMRLLKSTKHVKKLERRLVNLASSIFSKISADFEFSLEVDREGADGEWERLIAVLPVSELADMAKTLVRFTCFYRKHRGEEETVKEPVDVAVVSKSGGFRWVEKKDVLHRV